MTYFRIGQQLGPIGAQLGRDVAQRGRTCSNFGQSFPRSANLRPKAATLRRIWAGPRCSPRALGNYPGENPSSSADLSKSCRTIVELAWEPTLGPKPKLENRWTNLANICLLFAFAAAAHDALRSECESEAGQSLIWAGSGRLDAGICAWRRSCGTCACCELSVRADVSLRQGRRGSSSPQSAKQSVVVVVSLSSDPLRLHRICCPGMPSSIGLDVRHSPRCVLLVVLFANFEACGQVRPNSGQIRPIWGET